MQQHQNKVSPEDVEAAIVSERYFSAAEGVVGAYAVRDGVHPVGVTPSQEEHSQLDLVTFCVLLLANGCKVVGINYGPVDPAGFNAELGRADARARAVEQIWPLLGFRLRDELAKPVLTEADALADLHGTPRPESPSAR